MRIVLLFLFLMIGSPLFSADFAMISELGTSARSISLGNIQGFSHSPDTIFENPAGMYRIQNQAVSLFTTTIMDEVHYTSVAVSGRTPFGKIGLGFVEASVFDIAETDVYNNIDQSIYAKDYFDYKNSIYKFSFSRPINDRLHFGASYSFFTHTYYNISGKGRDFDAGVIYNADAFEVSTFFRNILPNSKVVYNNTSIEPLPMQLVVSGKLPYRSISLYPQVKIGQGEMLKSFGMDYKPSFMPFTTLNFGYKESMTVVLERKNNLTMGIGLSLFGLNIHYAYERSNHVLFDHKSYFSLSTAF